MKGHRLSYKSGDDIRVRTVCIKLNSHAQKLGYKPANLPGRNLKATSNLEETSKKIKSLDNELIQPILKGNEELDDDSVISKLNKLLTPKKSKSEKLLVSSKTPTKLIIKRKGKIKVKTPTLKY